MSGYDNATHTPDKSRADSMTNTTPHTPGCSNGTTSGRIGIVEAERLYNSNCLRELIGVGTEAQPVEVKAACKRALLLHHPDKGGCTEVFKLVQPATETLLLEENLCAFEGGVPSWAKLQLKDLADLRRNIVIWRTRLESARSKLEANLPASVRPRVQNDFLAAEKAVRNLNVILQQALVRFKNCYSEHVRVMRARAVEFEARRVKEAAEWALLKRNYRGVVTNLRQRHQRGGKRFPIMPTAVTCSYSRTELGVVQKDYLKVIRTIRNRLKRGVDATELESRSASLLRTAHVLVDECCDAIHAYVATHNTRFPVLPATDPRAPALAKLNLEQRRLARCIRWNTSNDHNNDIRTKIEHLVEQAITILETPAPVSTMC